MNKALFNKSILALSISTALTACGGSDGSGATPPASTGVTEIETVQVASAPDLSSIDNPTITEVNVEPLAVDTVYIAKDVITKYFSYLPGANISVVHTDPIEGYTDNQPLNKNYSCRFGGYTTTLNQQPSYSDATGRPVYTTGDEFRLVYNPCLGLTNSDSLLHSGTQDISIDSGFYSTRLRTQNAQWTFSFEDFMKQAGDTITSYEDGDVSFNLDVDGNALSIFNSTSLTRFNQNTPLRVLDYYYQLISPSLQISSDGVSTSNAQNVTINGTTTVKSQYSNSMYQLTYQNVSISGDDILSGVPEVSGTITIVSENQTLVMNFTDGAYVYTLDRDNDSVVDFTDSKTMPSAYSF
jgi:hypothetical protein